MLICKGAFVGKDGWWYKECRTCHNIQSLGEFPFQKLDAPRIYNGLDKRSIYDLVGPTASNQCKTCITDKIKARNTQKTFDKRY